MMLKTRYLLALTLILMSVACTNTKKSEKADSNKDMETAKYYSDEMFLFVGTYTSEGGSEGIYLYRMNIESGVVDSVRMIEANNPSYLVISKDEKHLYAVSESGENSTVSAFSFDNSTGAMSHINTQSTDGADPCYIEIDKLGNNVLTANYSGGSISMFSVRDDGGVSSVNSVINFEGSGQDESRQASPHLHSVRFSPDGRFLFATDLGTDKIYRFKSLESVFEGQPLIIQSDITEIDVPAGMGPRHFDFHPSNKYMYLLGELSGEVVVYDYNDGELSEKQTIVSDSLGARGAADIHVSPDGNFVYASNRLKGDGISIFSINKDDGMLTKVGYQDTGLHPRNFVITPNGSFLLVACRDDNKIQIFSIDKTTGLLSDTGKDIRLSKPVCLKFASAQ